PAVPAGGPRLERLRGHRRASTEHVARFHAAGGAGLSTARLVTAAADLTLEALWAELASAHRLRHATLVALGGSGRRETSPGSDWDLLLLHDGKGEVASFARAFTTLLWDVRVHLGWSLRTLAEAEEAARDDPSFRTSLLDARRIAGDATLWHRAERRRGRGVAAGGASVARGAALPRRGGLPPEQARRAPGPARALWRHGLPPRAQREAGAGRAPRSGDRAVVRPGAVPGEDTGGA